MRGETGMKISLNIILDVLQSFQLEKHLPEDGGLSFSMCLPLPDDQSALDQDCIYVSGLSRAMVSCSGNPGVCCICSRDRIRDGLETEARLSGLIIVNENITPTTLFTLVQNRFFTVISWVQQMQESLIHNGTMQQLVDMCIPVINNYINVSDSSLMLLAHSTKITCDDPICVLGAEHGYFPEEIIQIFRKYDLFKIWENAEAPYIDDSCEAAKYPTYHRVFKFGNIYFAHAVLTCCRNPLTKSMMDLFLMFTDVLAVYIERAWEEKNACNHIYDTFLTELIEGTITSKSAIAERAQYVGIPLTGQFCLFQIVTDDPANVSIGKMLVEFSELLPRIKFIRYHQRIVAIHHFHARDIEEQMQDICKSLEGFLKKYDALCGVSLFFSSLEDVQFSYKQSSLAIKYINRLRGSEIVRSINTGAAKESRVYFFSQFYIFTLFGENESNAELWYHCFFHGILKRLYEYDQRHKSNNLQLLFVFLRCERNATKAAAELNMHRNNVTYHISRIQELLGVDLEDSTARYMLLISYSLLELYGFDED
jgi:sugar diacid utilization regulator